MMKRFPSTSGNARIVVVTTGGTIVQKFDAENGGYVPKTTGKELIESIGHEINLERLELVEFSMIDSRAVDLKFLHDLAKLVQEKIDDELVDGVVIVHGTDTMEITVRYNTYELYTLYYNCNTFRNSTYYTIGNIFFI